MGQPRTGPSPAVTSQVAQRYQSWQDRLTSLRSTVCFCAVQHRASRSGRWPGRGRTARRSTSRFRALRGANPGWAGGWIREGPGHPVDNGGRSRCRRDALRSEGIPRPSSHSGKQARTRNSIRRRPDAPLAASGRRLMSSRTRPALARPGIKRGSPAAWPATPSHELGALALLPRGRLLGRPLAADHREPLGQDLLEVGHAAALHQHVPVAARRLDLLGRRRVARGRNR
jgi:hypothetical protein